MAKKKQTPPRRLLSHRPPPPKLPSEKSISGKPPPSGPDENASELARSAFLAGSESPPAADEAVDLQKGSLLAQASPPPAPPLGSGLATPSSPRSASLHSPPPPLDPPVVPPLLTGTKSQATPSSSKSKEPVSLSSDGSHQPQILSFHPILPLLRQESLLGKMLSTVPLGRCPRRETLS